MALVEQVERRTQRELPDGILYTRFYLCPTGTYSTDRPDLGSLMSGESGLLGARVISVARSAVSLAQRRGAPDQVVIGYRSFHAATGGVSSTNYAEIRPRKFEKTVHESQIITTAIATDETYAPHVGDVLSTDTAYLCVDCDVQKEWLPSRTLVTTVYSRPLLWSE